jgi:hypothetical protein
VGCEKIGSAKISDKNFELDAGMKPGENAERK